MFYVYVIRSIQNPKEFYIDFSENLKSRFADHNSGKSAHTSKFMPWELEWYCAFKNKAEALDFEKYLKSHSGRAFANKRLTPTNSLFPFNQNNP